MTSLEINKRIAELKGHRLIKYKAPDGEECIFIPDPKATFMMVRDDNKKVLFETSERVRVLPDWATNLSYAWELFEEMQDHFKYDCTLCLYKIYEEWGVGIHETEDIEAYSKAATAQEAICLAWIKWKEAFLK